MSWKVTEPVKDFREVFKDYYPSEIERITEILGALSLTEDEVDCWQKDISSNVIEPHCICGSIPEVGVIRIGTNPSFPDSIYVEVFSLNSVKQEEPNLVWFRGRVVESKVCFDEGAVLFPYEYIGASRRPIVHLDAEQLSSGEKPQIEHNHISPIAVPERLKSITLGTAGEVFLNIAQTILHK